jgi:hypothetical protein
MSQLASFDSVLNEHLRCATVSKSLKNIRNELLDCAYEVYKQTLMEEIQNVYFVSIRTDETTDSTCMCRFVKLLRHADWLKDLAIWNASLVFWI